MSGKAPALPRPSLTQNSLPVPPLPPVSRVSLGYPLRVVRVSGIRNKDQCLSPQMRGYLVEGDYLVILMGDNYPMHTEPDGLTCSFGLFGLSGLSRLFS